MKQVRTLIEELGGVNAVACSLELTTQAIWNWIGIDAIPPRWYHHFAALGKEHGIKILIDLFQEKSRVDRASSDDQVTDYD
jgi:hypothetical protein